MSGEQGALARTFLSATESLAGTPVSPAKPTIDKLNFSHVAIARWLLENPNKNLGECATHFGYTRSWLSIIVNSDAFQAHYRDLQSEADNLVKIGRAHV